MTVDINRELSPRQVAAPPTRKRRRSAPWGLARRAQPLVGIVIVIGVWYLLNLTRVVDPTLLPRPDEVAAAFWDELRSGELATNALASTKRVMAGMAIGFGLAVPVGVLLAWYPVLRRMFEPIVNFFRAIPPIALSPLVIVFLGIGELARVSILAYAAFFASVVIIYEGVTAIEEIYIRAARALGATEHEIFRKVALPLLVPQMFVALRLNVALCWGTLVAAELLAAEQGLGASIQNASTYFKMPDIYVGIITIGVLALVMDYIVRVAMARAVRWQERVAR